MLTGVRIDFGPEQRGAGGSWCAAFGPPVMLSKARDARGSPNGYLLSRALGNTKHLCQCVVGEFVALAGGENFGTSTNS
jgi:hypothetical protein